MLNNDELLILLERIACHPRGSQVLKDSKDYEQLTTSELKTSWKVGRVDEGKRDKSLKV